MTEAGRAAARRWTARAAAGCLAAFALGCAPVLTPGRPGGGPDDADRERFARHQIQMALSFRSQGRLESALHALDAALATAPDHARGHRIQAVVLEELGRLNAAERARARADALDPPPPLPPDEPLGDGGQGILVVLPAPAFEPGRPPRVAGGWPGGEAVTNLIRRLRTRLPDSAVLPADPEDMAEVQELLARLAPRAVLSLRIDRAFCGDSEKDGPFSVAWLRFAVATPGDALAPPETLRQVELIPPKRHCISLPIGRALEAVLAREAVAAALAAPGEPGAVWPARTVRELFPGLSNRIAEHLERGRARLATGRVRESLEAFRQAAAIDPDDVNVRAYVNEAELTLQMARELGGDDEGFAESGELEPQLTAAQRNATERLLDEQRERRDQLLAALVVLDAAERAPAPEALEHLRAIPVEAPTGPGPKLAAGLAEGPHEVRAYFAPDGRPLGRYWFSRGNPAPLLREEDTDGDGTPDRWEGYADGARRDRWEDRRGLGFPDLHLRFAASGDLERIEVDPNGDGQPERLFRYEAGVLASEARDTDDDGRLDRIERFDAEGYVTEREEDLDGDGEPDVRSFFERGSLTRREILNLKLVDELTR